MSVVINPTVATIGRSVTSRYFGTGDGSRVLFNLAGLDSDRAYLMPVLYLDQTLQTVTTHYTVDATGKVTFVTAPAAGKVVNYKDPHAPSGNIYRAFGMGDGTSVDFSLPFVPKVPVLYRNDWQGNQLLYPTPRTNFVPQSNNFTDVAWSATATITKDQTGPDGVANSAFTMTSAGAPGGYLAKLITLLSAQYVNSIWIKRLVGTGPVYLSLDGLTTTTDVSGLINSSTYTRVWVVQIANNPVVAYQVSTQNDSIAIFKGQLETGSAPTANIDTAASPVTVTDYTYTPSGDVAMAVAPVAGAILTADMNFGPTP